jgi:hypothetical protein
LSALTGDTLASCPASKTSFATSKSTASEEHYPAAFALWIAEVTGGPVPRFEKVEREEPADGVVIEGDER